MFKMLPMFLLFAGALGEDMSRLKTQILHLQPELAQHYMAIAKSMVPPKIWAAQAGFYKPLVGVDVKPICGCRVEDMFQLHDVFISNMTGGDVAVDFHPYADSEPLGGDIWYESSTVSTDSTNFKWEHSGEVSIEWSLQVAGSGPKGGLKFGYKVGQDTIKTKTKSLGEKRRHFCPQGHVCQVQTWTFSASIPGHYFKVPVVDFQCLPACLRWRHQDTELYHELNHTSKVALASLVGKSPTWDLLGQEYFELRDNENNPVAACPPGGYELVGIQFPPNSIETIYKQGRPDSPSMPIMDDSGKPYRMQVMMDFSRKHFPEKRESHVASLAPDDLASLTPEDAEIKVHVLNTNIPGLGADTNLGN